jgi:methionine synthase II (cobalamin-independent)
MGPSWRGSPTAWRRGKRAAIDHVGDVVDVPMRMLRLVMHGELERTEAFLFDLARFQAQAGNAQRIEPSLHVGQRHAGVEGFLPANSPGTIEHWLRNDHYKTEEEFVYAIADAMHEEYKAIADAGLILQLDDPGLPDGFGIHADMTVEEYRKFAEQRVDQLQRLENADVRIVGSVENHDRCLQLIDKGERRRSSI